MQTKVKGHLLTSAGKTVHTFVNVLPIIIGMLLATSLAITLLPNQISAGLFGHGELSDTVLGAAIGSVSAGHPLASYLLGGALLDGGVGVAAVTALLVTWVTVGLVQLPAEALMLGWRFALWRNLVSFLAAIVIALLTAQTLRLLGLGG